MKRHSAIIMAMLLLGAFVGGSAAAEDPSLDQAVFYVR
jgi:hypothetical protein